VSFIFEESAISLVDRVAQHAFGFFRVENRETAWQSDRFAVHAQRTVTDAVKRAAPKARRLNTRQLLHAVEHLLRRLVREGEE
jgi:hypothetical protein